MFSCIFFFQAEDGIRDLVRSRGLGDVYKRQVTLNKNIVLYHTKKDKLEDCIIVPLRNEVR